MGLGSWGGGGGGSRGKRTSKGQKAGGTERPARPKDGYEARTSRPGGLRSGQTVKGCNPGHPALRPSPASPSPALLETVDLSFLLPDRDRMFVSPQNSHTET